MIQHLAENLSTTHPTPPALVPQADFDDITALISAARQRAVQAVNTSLIELYWQVGQTISRKIGQAQWGDGVVVQLAEHLARTQPGLRGFTCANLFRMRQFYEVYRDDEKVAPLARQLPWTHNLTILNQSKRPEEREFYLHQAIWEKWSSQRAGAPVQNRAVRAHRAPSGKSDTGGGTNAPRRLERVQGQLPGRIPGPAARPPGG